MAGIDDENASVSVDAPGVTFRSETGWCAYFPQGNRIQLVADDFLGCGTSTSTGGTTSGATGYGGAVYLGPPVNSAMVVGDIFNGSYACLFDQMTNGSTVRANQQNGECTSGVPSDLYPNGLTVGSGDITASGGSVTAAGNMNANGFAYKAGSNVVPGVSCNAAPSSSFASVNGIVTHC